METFKAYDFCSWLEKRKLIWKNIQLPGEGVGMFDAWEAHSQLYRMLNNADYYYNLICKEEVNCRRERKQTPTHANLIKTFEDTVQILEDMSIMYRLTYG